MATTSQGTDPFAGFGGTPAPTPTTPPAGTPAPAPGDQSFQSFINSQGATAAGKTTFGAPTNLDQPITVPGAPLEAPFGRFNAPGTKIPNYVAGDEWAPHNNPDPDYARSIQIKMIQAGLLKLADVHLGLWDGTSANAYKKVLAEANLTGEPASAALDHYVSSSAAFLPKAALNKDDMAGVAQQVAQNVLGRNLDPVELDKFSAAFQSAYATAEGGPQTAAGTANLGERLLTQEHPKEAAATRLHAVSQHALSVLAGPSTSLSKFQS